MIYEIHLLAFVCWQLVPSSAAVHLGLGEWAEECMEGSSELTHLLLPSFPFVFSIKDPLKLHYWIRDWPGWVGKSTKCAG